MEIKEIKQLLNQQSKGLQKYVEDRLTKQTKELKEDYNRQGKFILDEFKHQTSIIAEQYTSLNKKVDNMGNKLDATFEEVGKLRVNVGKNTTDIEIIKQDTQIIKSGLKQKVDLKEFEALEKRVILPERKFQAI